MEKEDGGYVLLIPEGNLRSLPGLGDSRADPVWPTYILIQQNQSKCVSTPVGY